MVFFTSPEERFWCGAVKVDRRSSLSMPMRIGPFPAGAEIALHTGSSDRVSGDMGEQQRTMDRDAIRRALPGALELSRCSVHAAPSRAGSYLLLIHLPRTVNFNRSGLEHAFQPGWFIYAGSARGPGGLRARLQRHFRAEKKLHWHIDSLTTVADEIIAFAIEGARECDLASALLRTETFRPALAGFGSSDCTDCATHLLVPIG